MRVLHIVFVVATTIGLIRCELQARAVPKDNVVASLSHADAAMLPPLRVVVGIDESGSMATANVAPTTVASLAPIFDRLETSGGELAVAFITEQSNGPFLRLYIPQPPDALTVTHRTSGNIFEAAAEKKHEDQERGRYAAQYRTWRADASARVNAFSVVLGQRLQHAPVAPRTDIRSALARANLFLAEPITYTRPPKNLAIFITDGIDNSNGTPAPAFSVPADIFIVNGSGTIAYLMPLHPTRFESLESALRFAVPEGGRNVRG